MKQILLDLFCKAGGCTRGYQLAGFYVVGVDIEPQPHYIGDEFIQAEALEFLDTQDLSRYHAFHGSPPCQFGSVETRMEHRSKHPNLIPQTRRLLRNTGKPYIIENVENVRGHLENPVMLCGSMFGLGVWRHRYFECPWLATLTPPCNHSNVPVLITGTPRRKGNRKEFTVQQCRDAADIQWMTRREIDEAIPPAYTEFIGRHLMEYFSTTVNLAKE